MAVGLTLIASAQGFAPHGGLLGRRQQQRTAKPGQGTRSVQGYEAAAGSSTSGRLAAKPDSVGALSLSRGLPKAREPWWKLSAASSVDVSGEGAGEAAAAVEGEKPKKKRAAVRVSSSMMGATSLHYL